MEFVCSKQPNVFIRAKQNRLYAKWQHELIGFVYSAHNHSTEWSRREKARFARLCMYACMFVATALDLVLSMRCQSMNAVVRLLKFVSKHIVNATIVHLPKCRHSVRLQLCSFSAQEIVFRHWHELKHVFKVNSVIWANKNQHKRCVV